jgi:peptide/nickel transport system substrate-binding protein
MHKLSFALVPMALSLLVAACGPAAPAGSSSGGSAAQSPAAPKRLVTAIRGVVPFVPTSLNAGGGGRIDGNTEVNALANAGLSVEVWPDAHREPILAEALPSVENGLWKVMSDGSMETTWKIRAGAAWHDGTPVTSADYVFTSMLSQDRDMPWLPDRIFQYIDKVEGPDPSTVKVTWKSAYIRADEAEFNPLYPKHILETPYTTSDKANISNLPFWNTEYIGTGPFKVKQFLTDDRIIFSPFENWVFGKPKVDELEVRFIPDDNALAANLLAGEVQFTLGPGLSIEQGIQIRDRWTEGSMIVSPSGDIKLNTQFLNPDPPILANKDFRKGLYTAIDRQALVDELLFGLSKPLDSPISESDPEYKQVQSQIVRYKYDPRQAAQLIESNGLRKGSDGMYVDASGKPVVVQIMATQDDSNAKPQAAVLDMWKRVGITPELEAVSQQRQRDLEYRSNFKAFALQSGQTFHADGFNCLHSRDMRTADKRYVGCNYARYNNPQMDQLIERYFTTIPFNERMQILGQMVHIGTDDLTQMHLYERVIPTMVSNKAANVNGIVGIQPANAHLWDIKS